MFESLLEQILQKYLGKLILGLNSQNLKVGIWRGNVVIENVSIRPDIFQGLNLPISLKFSSIGKLSLQVPWSNLSSSPIEILLDRVYLIIVPKPQADWDFVDFTTMEKKMEIINDYVRRCIEKFLEKEKKNLIESPTAGKSPNNQGYLEKLKLIIMDNIQVKLTNVHLRFENEGIEGFHQEIKYSWGVTLDKLEIFTTDKDWHKTFYDRNEPKNKDKPMNKKLILSSLSIYWNSKEEVFLKDQQIIDSMTNLIKTNKESNNKTTEILSLSSIIKLVQKTSHYEIFDSPEFQIDIELAIMNILFMKPQLQEIIHLIDFFQSYQQAIIQLRKSVSIVSEEDKSRHRKDFILIFEKIQSSQCQNLEVLSQDEKQLFIDIIMSETLEEILPWVKIVIHEFQKKQKFIEFEKTKKKQAKGWFSGWWGGATEGIEASNEEKVELESYFEKNFSNDNLTSTALRPKDYIWFQLDFRLEEGCLTLRNFGKNGEEEGVKFRFENVEMKLRKRGERYLQVSFEIMEFYIDFVTRFYGETNEIKSNFLMKNEIIARKDEAFLNMKFERFPDGEVPENEIQPDMRVSLISRSTKIRYNSIGIYRLIDFFNVKLEHETLKDSAWQQIENINDATKKNIGKLMKNQQIIKIDVLLESPYVIIPFKPNNDPLNECWVIQLGTLKLMSNEALLLRKDMNTEENILDMYDFQLLDFKMQYFTSYESFLYAYSLSSADKIKPEHSFSLIPKFSIFVSMQILKSEVKDLIKNQPHFLIKAKFDNFTLNLSSQIYQKLLKITDCLIFSDDKTDSIEALQTETNSLLTNAKKISELWRRTHATHAWERYMGVLSGPYIYFFRKQMDLSYMTYQYIRNSLVKKVDDGVIGRKNVFSIENRYGSVYLACEKSEEVDIWLENIKNSQTNIKLFRKETNRIMKKNEIDKENPEKCKLSLEFEWDLATVNFIEEDLKNVWFIYRSNGLKMTFNQYPYDFMFVVGLKHIEIIDSLRNYEDQKLNKLISCNGNQMDSFLNMKLRYIDHKHPKYEKIDTDLEIELGDFLFNFKPDTILKLLAFLKSNKQNIMVKDNPEEIIKNTKENLIYNEMDQELIVFNLKLFIKQVSLQMIHRKNHLSIAEVNISNTNLSIQSKLQEFDLELQFGNLQIMDLTNYPKTLHLEQEYLNSERRELFGIDLKTPKQDFLFNVKYFGFSSESPKIQNKVSDILLIDVNSIRMDLALQPIYRILDYIFVQIVGVFISPEIFDSSQIPLNEKPQNKNQIIQSKSFKTKSNQELLAEIENITYLSMDFMIRNPRIYVNSSRDSNEYLIFDLGLIKFQKERQKVQRNNEKQALYCNFYRIWMKDMGIRVIRETEEFKLSKPFHYNFEIEKPCFIEEYKEIFPDEDLDYSLKIRSRVFPVVLSLYKADYLLIMKLLYSNILFDDLMDKFHYHDYQIPLQSKPSSRKLNRNTTMTLINHKPLIQFQVDIDNITLFIMNPLKSSFDIRTPLARIAFDRLRVTFLRNISDVRIIQIFGDKLRGTYFEDDKEFSLFGDFLPPEETEFIKEFELSELSPQFLKCKSKEYTPEFIYQKMNIINPNLKVRIIISPSWNKEINVNLDTVKANFHAAVIRTLSQFAMMDDTVSQQEPIGKAFINEESIEDINAQNSSKLTITIDIRNIMILISSPENQRPLALSGNMNIDLEWQASKSIEELLEKIANLKKEKKKTINEYELNRIFSLIVQLQGIELFICHYEEIAKKTPLLLKRNILLPSKLSFNFNKYLVLTQNQLFLAKNKCKIQIDEKMTLKISYQDVLNLQKIIDYQQKTLQKEDFPMKLKMKSIDSPNRLKSLAVKVLKQSKISSLLLKKQKSSMKKDLNPEDILGTAAKKGDIMKLSDSEYEISTKDIELVIVNDVGDAFIPVIIFYIHETEMIIKYNLIVMNVLFPLTFSISYYNPQVSHWEPIIEKAELIVELTTKTFNSPNFELKISSKTSENLENLENPENIGHVVENPENNKLNDDFVPLNINISTQMLNAILNTLKLLRKDQKESKVGFQKMVSIPENQLEVQKTESEIKGHEFERKEEIEYISPYSIKNETGYEIEVRDHGNEDKVYYLENGETVNLQLEFTKRSFYSIQENETRISIRLKRSYVKYQPIMNLDMTRVKITRYALKDIDLKEEEQIYLISEVGLDKDSNRRLITISSELIFRNRSLRDLVIRIYVFEEKCIEMVLPKEGWVPIPLDLVRKKMMLRFKEGGLWGDKYYSLDKFITNNPENGYELEMISNKLPENHEIKNYLIAFVEKEGRGYGKTVAYIDPPFIYKNCLPVNMELKLKSIELELEEKVFKLAPQEIIHEYEISLAKKLMVSIRVNGFDWSEVHKLYAPNNEVCREIVIKDHEQNEAKINILYSGSYNVRKEFKFYLKTYIINETNYGLWFYGLETQKKSNKKKKSLLAGQKNKDNEEFYRNMNVIFLTEGQEALEISERNSEEWCSKEVGLGTIGDIELEIRNKEGFFNLGACIKLICVDYETNLYTKIISFTPRHVFMNNLPASFLGIRQSGTSKLFLFKKDERKPINWADNLKPLPSKSKKIQISLINTIILNEENPEIEAFDSEWSEEIDITSLGKVNFLLRMTQKSLFKYMKADISNDQGLIYIKFDEYKPGFEPYHIEQSLDEAFDVFISQASSKDQAFNLKSGIQIPYCWDHPCENKMMILTIKDHNNQFHEFSQLISIDKIESKVNFILHSLDKIQTSDYLFQVIITIENQSKKVLIRKSEPKEKNLIIFDPSFSPKEQIRKSKPKEKSLLSPNEPNEKSLINRQLVISCCFSHLGISLIQNSYGRKTREIFYLTLRNLEFCQVDTAKSRIFQLKAGYVNIDNNHAYLVNFPVLLTPSEFKKITEKGGYVINCYIEKSRKHEEINVFKSIKLDLEALSLKLEDSLIPILVEFYLDISELLWPHSVKNQLENSRYFFQLNKNERPLYWFWEKDEIVYNNQQTFIDEFILSPIKLNFSFLTKSKGSEFHTGIAFFSMFSKAFGVALMNIDDAPIKLKGLKLENCFDTTQGIVMKLLSHYRDNLATEIFKLLGSINIIGNPVGLFSQIGTGVQDLIEKPIEGIIKGPLEGGIGLMRGAESLLKHTFAGTFNSIDKITGSLGSGIAFLSFDDEYLAQREKMKLSKPKHVGEGLKHAGLSIFKGFEKGITGVFMKPFEGASKDGVKGFLKGTYQGVTGLIIKPVSGVLDAASKTAEGIKNTAMGSEDRPRELRERLVRVFYSFDQFYQDYDQKDAELNYFLQVELKKGRFAEESYFFGYLFEEEEGKDRKMVLFVTSDNLIYFNKKTMKKKWIVETNKIEEIERNGRGIEIKMKENRENKKEIEIQDEEERNFIYSSLKDVMKIIKNGQIQF